MIGGEDRMLEHIPPGLNIILQLSVLLYLNTTNRHAPCLFKNTSQLTVDQKKRKKKPVQIVLA